ncbi:hypothetical protein CHUAL_012755 [Chamberlinius hualienensis]
MFDILRQWLPAMMPGHGMENLYDIGITAFGVAVVAYLLYVIYRPMNRVRELSDIGYWHLKKLDKRKNAPLRDLVNDLIKQQKVGTDIPPIYPNGWFVIAESRDLKRGSIIPVSALGQDLVVFRGEDGVIHVTEAYCPHLGASLAVGARVLGDCIECPFHGWKFKGSDGSCTGIPYADKIPAYAKIRVWESRELNGYIYLWHHAEGEKPYWEPVEVEEIAKGQWVYRGRSEHYVRAHIQEIPENGADWAHLSKLHGPSLYLGADISNFYNHIWDVAVHIWEASWSVSGDKTPHISQLDIEHSFKLFGKLDLITIKARVNQIGPATVQLKFSTPFGKCVLFHNVTPVEPLVQKITHALYCESSMPVLYSKLVLYGEAIMVERDMMIWNHKIFLNKPLLVKEDKYIPKLRRWYQQFYSENSPRLSFRKDTLEW